MVLFFISSYGLLLLLLLADTEAQTAKLFVGKCMSGGTFVLNSWLVIIVDYTLIDDENKIITFSLDPIWKIVASTLD